MAEPREIGSYGRSPAMTVLDDVREANRLDEIDIRDGTDEAAKRMMHRHRLLWRLMGLIK